MWYVPKVRYSCSIEASEAVERRLDEELRIQSRSAHVNGAPAGHFFDTQHPDTGWPDSRAERSGKMMLVRR